MEVMKRAVIFLGLPLLAALLTGCPMLEPPVSSTCPGDNSLSTQSLDPTWTVSSTPAGLADFTQAHVPGELIVYIKNPQVLSNAAGATLRPLFNNWQSPWYVVQVAEGQEEAAARSLLNAGANFVQPNYLYQLLRTPNDPKWDYQKPYFDELLQLPAIWEQTTGDASLHLAVIDTGYMPHPDLLPRLTCPSGKKLDVADQDTDPRDPGSDDGKSHGTAVAGVLGAVTNNTQGIAGVTWVGPILPLKVFHDGSQKTSTTNITAAIELASSLGARVINLSLGSSASDTALSQAMAQARNQGVVIVAAAGNDGGAVLFPAKDPATIAVGAVDSSKQRASFSNTGPELDLVAPGVNVYSFSNQRSFAYWSGTSIAAPFVSGIVALYMSAYHTAYGDWPNPDQVYQCLTQTAEDLGLEGKDDDYGFGLVRPDRIINDANHCFP